MIYPVFHPIVDIQEGRVAWYEALARIQGDPTRTHHGPLLSVAEQYGFIQHVDLSMLSQVIEHVSEFDVPVAINLSAQTVEGAYCSVIQSLEAKPVARGRLIVEITETTPIRDEGRLLAFKARLRDSRIRLAIDDFGSGNWTDRLVTLLQPDIVKVSWRSGAVDAAIVLARLNGADLVVEYVDSPLILASLRDMGVRYAQGYLFGKPATISELSVISSFFVQEALCASF